MTPEKLVHDNILYEFVSPCPKCGHLRMIYVKNGHTSPSERKCTGCEYIYKITGADMLSINRIIYKDKGHYDTLSISPYPRDLQAPRVG